MAVRRLYEPLCIAFGTTVSSPTVPTYQLYDLPHKFTPRLYMESEKTPIATSLVLREIGVRAGWEQAGSANTRSFLLDLLNDEGAAHDNFLPHSAFVCKRRRRATEAYRAAPAVDASAIEPPGVMFLGEIRRCSRKFTAVWAFSLR